MNTAQLPPPGTKFPLFEKGSQLDGNRAKKKLLWLGISLPPGVSALFPEVQPQGHKTGTCLVNSLRPWFEIRSVCISPIDVNASTERAPGSPGLRNELNLLDRPPELWHRWRSLARLRAAYAHWERADWQPDVILVKNFFPIYNAFIREMRRRTPRPLLVLRLEDSVTLGRAMPPLKRLRYSFKPFMWDDNAMADCFDACAAINPETEPGFNQRNIPWMWMTNGIDPGQVRLAAPGPVEGPVIFGYCGNLANYAGVPQLLRVFTAKPRAARLRICGFGKARAQLEAQFGSHPAVSFHGPMTPDECVNFATQCDVMLNPRPVFRGNDNNFPSKIMDYAQSGRAILSSLLSGVEILFGEDLLYFDPQNFDASLDQALERVSRMPREELRRIGQAAQQRALEHFSWAAQGERLANFLLKLTRDIPNGVGARPA